MLKRGDFPSANRPTPASQSEAAVEAPGFNPANNREETEPLGPGISREDTIHSATCRQSRKEYCDSLTPDDLEGQRAWGAFAEPQPPASLQNPDETEPATAAETPALDDETRRRKQLEILNHFGTIDFDLDPIEIRRLDRERARVRIKS